jgi:integrase
MRRGAGEGTIIKRKTCDSCGKVTSSKDNDKLKVCKCGATLPKTCTWMAATITGFDYDKAKPIRKYFYGKTRDEVLEKMNQVQQRVNNGLVAEPSKMRFAEWIDKWLNDYMKPSLRPTTWESYESQVKNHIKPTIGHLRLNQLQTADLQKLYNDKFNLKSKKCLECKKVTSSMIESELQTCKHCDSTLPEEFNKLSPRSIKYIHTVIHGALSQAQDEGLILRNPAKHAKVPTQEKKEIKYLSADDVGKFLSTAREYGRED